MNVGPNRLRVAMIGVRGLASAPLPEFSVRGQQLVGGAELAAEELSRQLALRGHDVTLFTRGGEAGRTPEGVRLQPKWLLRGRRFEALSHSLVAALSATRQQFDLVHFHAVGPASCAGVSRLRGLPSVVTVQGLDWEREKWVGWERRLIKRLAMLGLRLADGVIVVAPTLRETAQASGARRIAVIPNGYVDPGPGERASLARWDLEAGAYLLMLGRLVPEKNVHRVIAAYRRTGLPWPLVIAGGGSHTDGYVTRLRTLAGDSRKVRLVGPVQGAEKAALLRFAGGFINASSIEGLSLALLEALGTGVPVAVSAIPGNTDVFELVGDVPGGVTMFDPQAEGDLEQAMRRLVATSSAERMVWSRYAERVRDAFSWRRIGEETEAFYRRVLARGARRRGSAR